MPNTVLVGRMAGLWEFEVLLFKHALVGNQARIGFISSEKLSPGTNGEQYLKYTQSYPQF